MSTTVSGDTGIDKFDGTTIAGHVIQVANYTTGVYSTNAGTIPNDNTIPQITEGMPCFSLAFTAKKATSKLKITVVATVANSATTEQSLALFKDSVVNAIGCVTSYLVGTNFLNMTCICYVDATDTSSHTFSVRTGGSSGTSYLNGYAGQYFGGSLASSITIEEIAQ